MAWKDIRARIEIAVQRTLFRYIAFAGVRAFIEDQTLAAKDALRHLKQIEQWLTSLDEQTKVAIGAKVSGSETGSGMSPIARQIIELETFDFSNGRELIQSHLNELAPIRAHLKNRDVQALKEAFKRLAASETPRIDLVGGTLGVPVTVPAGEETPVTGMFRIQANWVYRSLCDVW